MLTSFLLLVTILMLSLANEGIIHCLHFCISSYVIFSLSLLSSVFTTIYSINILVYCFNYVLFVYSGYLSIIVPVLTLSSLLIDESLDLDLVNYTSAHFSIIVWIAHFYAIFLYYVISRNPLLTLDPLILCSVQTFIFPLLSFCSLILSSYFFNGHFSWYGSYFGMNYSNVIGFFLLVSFIIQFCSGMLLSIYYEDYYMICFDSVVFITCEVSNGWFVRLLHVLGATLFNVFVYFHWIRGSWLMFRLFYNVYWIWLSGWCLFICSLIEGFLGYILNWGQMSYWGITVMINILSIIPYFGNIIAELIWCSSNVIINRIFIIHFMFGFLIGGLVIVHIIILHSVSSSLPLINNMSSLLIPFAIFCFNDYFSYMAVFGIYSTFLFIEPDILGNVDNLILANSLTTPLNIIPEWYFLLLYSVLSAIPVNLIGANLVLLFFIILINVSNTNLLNKNKTLVLLGIWLIIFSFIPTMMLFIKFFVLFLLLIHSIYFIISSVIFLMFIFQGLFLSCFLLAQLVFLIVYSSSFSTLFFILELQYMLFVLLFLPPLIISKTINSIWSGLCNYLVMNGILSFWLTLGILTSNSMFFLVSCFGKIGYFPFFLIIMFLVYCSSYSFIIFDQIINFSYLFSFSIIFNLSYFTIDYFLCLFNFLLITVFIKFLFTINHLVLISSIVLFIMIYLLIMIEDMLYSIIYL